MSTIRIFPAGLSAAHRVTALLMRTLANEAITYWVRIADFQTAFHHQGLITFISSLDMVNRADLQLTYR
jgi:hypothetical protein